MSAALDTEIITLVGELEQVPCDFPQHGQHPVHTDEPASHYVRCRCPLCGDDTGVIAACPGFIAAVRGNALGLCRACNMRQHALDLVTILGPVAS